MNSLAQTRQLLALQLRTAGVTVHEYVPERITPPCAVLEPANPYIDEGTTFTEMRVHLNVVLFATHATNEVATATLDQVLCEVINEVDAFDLESVEQPSSYEVGTGQYLGTRIAFSTTTEIES